MGGHPERSWLRNMIFQIQMWVGAGVSAYVLLMSISGSIIVWQNELWKRASIAWLVTAHDNLLSRSDGKFVNGLGGICLVSLCLTGAVIWWPGIRNWRRNLTVNWRAHFARINWDLHSALGLWSFVFILVWGLSAVYFAFPGIVNPLLRVDPADRYTDQGFFWLAQLHFGRFGRLSELVWSIVALAPAVLAFTGVFICCRRIIYKKPSNPNLRSD